MPKKTGPGKGNGGGSGGDTGGDTGSTTQTIRGSRHYDEYTLPGSRLDYDVTTDGNGNWTVIDLNPDDGDLGTMYFTKWEGFQFDDEFVNIWNQHPYLIDGPERFRITLGESVEFTITASDGDGIRSDMAYYMTTGTTRFGLLTRTETQTYTVGGGPAEVEEATFVYDSSSIPSYRQDYVDSLALGEISEQVMQFGAGARAHTVVIEVVGVNDAPQLTDFYWDIAATHLGASGIQDLAPAGFDIDSDDTGASLTYEIVSVTEGFDVTIEGTQLILTGGAAQAHLDSDETVTGEVEIRARDSHGAYAPSTITVDLAVTGSGRPIAPDMFADGTIDLAGLGVDLGAGPVYDILDGYADDPMFLDLIAATDGDDLWQINAARMGNFSAREGYYDLYEDLHGPLLNYQSLPIELGLGDDIAVLNMQSDSLASLETVGVATNEGDDIVIVNFDTPGVAYAQTSISTGMGSDQVYIRMDGGRENLFAGSVSTGSGHDYVDVRLNDSVPDDLYDGFAVVNGGFTLGSGNDHLHIEISGHNALSSAGVGLGISGGDGDDYIYFSNADVTLRPDAIGYKGGYDGSIDLGQGADELILNLSVADGWSNELEIDGGYRDESIDVLVLQHLTAQDDFTVTREFGYFGDSIFTIEHFSQSIRINAVEVITLGDGTDLYALV